jgi:hypothetical protein
MTTLQRLFTEHPASVNETYLQHLRSAMCFGSAMVLAGIACMIHGLLPAAFITRGSDTIRVLYDRMITNRCRFDPREVATRPPVTR